MFVGPKWLTGQARYGAKSRYDFTPLHKQPGLSVRLAVSRLKYIGPVIDCGNEVRWALIRSDCFDLNKSMGFYCKL